MPKNIYIIMCMCNNKASVRTDEETCEESNTQNGENSIVNIYVTKSALY